MVSLTFGVKTVFLGAPAGEVFFVSLYTSLNHPIDLITA